MKAVSTALLVCFFALVAVQSARAEDATYDEHGIRFTYPKDWNIKTDSKKEVTTVVVNNNKGTTITILLNNPTIEPKTITDQLETSFKKIFEGKIAPKSEKEAKRKLFGAERPGRSLEIELAKGTDLKTKVEWYAFKPKSSPYMIAVALTTTSIDTEGQKALDALTDSLTEKKTPEKK